MTPACLRPHTVYVMHNSVANAKSADMLASMPLNPAGSRRTFAVARQRGWRGPVYADYRGEGRRADSIEAMAEQESICLAGT